jgi:hypothetical protein
MAKLYRIALIASVGSVALFSGCLTDNFWAEKVSEILNLTIISAADALIGGLTGGAINLV